MKLVDGSQTFDRVDLGTVKLNRKKKAAAHAVPVHENGAGAANTVLAANMRARETERLSEKIGEKQPRFDRALEGVPFTLMRIVWLLFIVVSRAHAASQ